jgi:hypothetical protein
MSTADLSWFYTLAPEHQVDLLSDPHRLLSTELADQLPKSVLSPESWQGEPSKPRLEASVIDRLQQILDHLDRWWELLTGAERDRLITQHADEELVADEARALQEKPALVTAYIEMKARQRT